MLINVKNVYTVNKEVTNSAQPCAAGGCSSTVMIEVIKLFSCSTQLGTEFILLINVKMQTNVGFLTSISMINTASERLKAK